LSPSSEKGKKKIEFLFFNRFFFPIRPFLRAEDSLQNVNNVSESVLSETLRDFIELNVPKGKGVELGVIDDKLGVAIQEQTGVACRRGDDVRELLRGCRTHFTKFVKPLRDGVLEKAQLGLGHAYSRAKVKFNVNRADNMIIQSIALVDQIDKDLNTLSMRLREWYSYIFPELARLVADHYTYARLVLLLGNRDALQQQQQHEHNESDNLFQSILAELTRAQAVSAAAVSASATTASGASVAIDPETVTTRILAAARRSIGADVGELDLISVRRLAEKIVALAEYRKRLYEYLQSRMDSVAPSLTALIGETLGARLISHAGSLTNLAKCPASTVQILGAEKALFRALKTRGNTPKYGLLFHSSFIGRAGLRNKGRIARYLANKCSIASRLDSFSDTPAPFLARRCASRSRSDCASTTPALRRAKTPMSWRSSSRRSASVATTTTATPSAPTSTTTTTTTTLHSTLTPTTTTTMTTATELPRRRRRARRTRRTRKRRRTRRTRRRRRKTRRRQRRARRTTIEVFLLVRVVFACSLAYQQLLLPMLRH
jgi:nucleolar protein 56